ncbi:hypothetical protein NC653_041963 [Populus alba x Populus x berolinensis]|uniref:Uncharacterized protein n=1 Tax=Populus alba x Populus x berolinensis TaxID=444605 RepID=A0AAD6L9T8_9ROSI|nr:hypothetical protein NC653_041963 [Populus alba x Populus x berolinensis]
MWHALIIINTQSPKPNSTTSKHNKFHMCLFIMLSGHKSGHLPSIL